MKREIPFDAESQRDRKDYRLLCDALITRGSQARDARTGEVPRLSKDEMRADARIKRALWAIGEADPESEALKGDEPDRRPRILAGGTLTLEQPDFSRLMDYVGNCQWTVIVVDEAMELIDRMDAAKQVTDDGTEKPVELNSRRKRA